MKDLIDSLVTNLTGLKEDHPNWTRVVEKVRHDLKYLKCTSTSEREVDDSFKGLADKFIVKGRHELAEALLMYKSEFLSDSLPIGSPESNQQKILKYDMLKLLLCLSSSTHHISYTPKPSQITRSPQLTWENIIDEEPLEGDHWKSWADQDTSTEELSDKDAFEVDDRISKPKDFTVMDNEQEPDYFERMELDHRENPEALHHLVSQQYWRPDFLVLKGKNDKNARLLLTSIDYPTESSLLQNPCKLSDKLIHSIYTDRDTRSLKVINELDVIREVLFLLNGREGIIFEYNDHQQRFLLKDNYLVQHLSQGALISVLKEFFSFGNIILNLRRMVMHILSESQYGQTAQAFAEVVYESLLAFEGLLSNLERDTSLTTNETSKVVSLLKLRNEIQNHLRCFQELHDIAAKILFVNNSPMLIAYYLISTLYEHTLLNQLSGQNTVYDALLYVLQRIIVPFGRLMDDWMFYGSLKGDTYKEFYIARNEKIHISSANVWKEGFSIIPLPQESARFPCPLFEKRNMERIYFTGKAVNVLLQAEKIQKQQLYRNYDFSLFSRVLQNFLPKKQPFISPIDNSFQGSTPKRTDVLAQNLFPMIEATRKLSSNTLFADHQDQISNDAGCLFDQNFIQCVEKYIEQPYASTAERLNSVLHKHCCLQSQLDSLATVYLMLENDLMHSFCEIIFTQMDKNEYWFDQRILNSVFIEACKSSGYDETVYIETRKIKASTEINTMASMLELIDFKIQISWPLNNFILEGSLVQYSKVTQFLFRIRRAKYVLEKKTFFKGEAKNDKNDVNAKLLYALRMKMLWFVNTFWHYITTTVLYVETIALYKNLSSSTDADEITTFHSTYMDRIVKRCMLDDKSIAIKRAATKVFNLTENLSDLFFRYAQLEHSNRRTSREDTQDSLRFEIYALEKEFNHTYESVIVDLKTLSKEEGMPWCETLSASLNA
ncbi:hypothetical protein BCV72DRAFT_265192 [Rhizopus microsporus var. microsporus]|uniref:Spindle pole body component n=1 Tax=Rhizopus microsporus var. microsporus TaxID=86635 RepID=A0A1X0QRR3_RHIZD|nr:hypothetical protein BCV72DRAFT_265192 [Rhizopus microsporus var. microsporus]